MDLAIVATNCEDPLQQLILLMSNLNLSVRRPFEREQHQLEMIRMSHAEHIEAGKGKVLGLELLLNQIGGIFKPDEMTEEANTIQAVLSAQSCKSHS